MSTTKQIAKQTTKAIMSDLSDRSCFNGIDDDLIEEIRASIQEKIADALQEATNG